MPALHDVVDLIHGWYPPATAEDWDAVGLVCGDPDQQVRKVMLAVDPSPAVAAEAADWKADLLDVGSSVSFPAARARRLDLLADLVEQHLDVGALLALARNGVPELPVVGDRPGGDPAAVGSR